MKILVVVKPSKLEWDAQLAGGARHEEVIEGYKKAGANWQSIVDSHKHQLAMRHALDRYLKPHEFLPLHTFVNLDATRTRALSEVSLVISLGGDNSFTRISHFLDDHPILGITVDPIRSVGAMNSYKMFMDEDAMMLPTRLLDRRFVRREEWVRAECEVDGKKLRLATSELYLGERLRKNMSRHILLGKEQKSSGLIVATPAGTTGWFHSASRQKAIKETENNLKYFVTEPYIRSYPFQQFGDILPGEEFIVQSLNDDGYVSIDSWEEVPFNRGSVAKIRIGKPLKVMKL